MNHHINTLQDLEFALEYVKPNDVIMMPKAMYEVNVYRLNDRANKLRCVAKHKEWELIYSGKDSRGVEVILVPLR
jgi:hypothetical protein